MSAYFIRLAWKNIWRNARRTSLTVAAIAFAVMALVSIRNYYDAFHEQIVANVIRYHSGHLTVEKKGYEAKQQLSTFLNDFRPIQEALLQEPRVQASAPRVVVNGLVSTAHGSANSVLIGIDPLAEATVTKFHQNVTSGGFFEADAKSAIVLGIQLAELLGARVGSKVVVLTQGLDGSIGNELFRVSGIFDSKSNADRVTAFLPIAEARKLASLPENAVHVAAVMLKSEKELESFRSDFRARLPSLTSEAETTDLLMWSEIHKHIKATIELDQALNRMLMFIILSVAGMGVANSILMSILERTRELGVMLAVGTRKFQVVGLVVLETLFLSLIGVFLGNALSFGLISYLGKVGFDLKWLSSNEMQVDGAIINTITYPTFHWQNSVSVTLVILSLALLISYFPARIVSRLKAIEALRAV